MGFLNLLLSLLDDLTSEDYLESSKIWFDCIWQRLNHPYKGEGILIIRNGKFYRILRVTFDDDTTLSMMDEKENGYELRHINLKQKQKDEALRKGYIVLKYYRS